MTCPEGYAELVEGLARICVPEPRLYRTASGIYEPALMPVFYNPNMVENRDISVMLLRFLLRSSSARELAVLDPMAATGVRAVRFLLEVGDKSKEVMAYIGDISTEAVKLIKINLELNKVSRGFELHVMDANEYMFHLKRRGVVIDYVDVDPFGSPAPFLPSAVQCVRNLGVLGVTATDTAVLEGKYPQTLLRRYWVAASKTAISKDVAVRALLSFTAKIAATYDRYVEPLFCYYRRHYVRIYVRVIKGGTMASKLIERCLGRLAYCNRCGYYLAEPLGMRSSTSSGGGSDRCPNCGSKLVIVEPLWLCSTALTAFVDGMVKEGADMFWVARPSLSIVGLVHSAEKVGAPAPFRLSVMARYLGALLPRTAHVIKCLSDKGLRASQSPFYADGVVTNAQYNDVKECVLESAAFS